MKTQIFAWILIAIVLSMTASALKDTTLDYISYRELVAGEAGVVYKIKITNYGPDTKTYELIPNADVVKQIGSYRVDPSSKVTIRSGKEEILYFYLTVNNGIQSRVEIPAKLVSGTEKQDLVFTVRSISPMYVEHETTFTKFMKILFYVIILGIFVMLLVIIFRKANKGKKKKGKDEVETYY